MWIELRKYTNEFLDSLDTDELELLHSAMVNQTKMIGNLTSLFKVQTKKIEVKVYNRHGKKFDFERIE